MTAEEIQQAKDYAELMGKEYVAPVDVVTDPVVDPVVDPDKPADPVTAKKIELSNEDLLALLNERGIQANNLDDLKPKPTEAELAAIKEKRKSDMLAYGLTTGKFKAEDYDKFQAVSSKKLDLIKDELTEELTAANPDITPEQIEERVSQFTFSYLEPTDILRIRREKELAELADNKLKKQFGNIINLESDFEQYEQGITTKTNFENKVKAALPVYRNDLKAAFDSLGTIEILVEDKENAANNTPVKLSFSKDDLDEVENALSTPEQIVRQVKNGFTPESIKEEAEMILIKKNFTKLISQAAKNYNSIQKDRYIRGVKGIIPANTNLDVADDDLGGAFAKEYAELREGTKEIS